MIRAFQTSRPSGRTGSTPMVRDRRGYTIVELVVTSILLGAVFSSLAPILGSVNRLRQSGERRQLALLEVANLMEELSTRPWAQLTAEGTEGIVLSDAVAAALPDAELAIRITPEDSEVAADAIEVRRIEISLRWREQGEQFIAPVRLVTWRYAPTAGEDS